MIRTDFERSFIRAETSAYDDYIKYKGEAGARDAGRLRLEAKDDSCRKATCCTSASTSERPALLRAADVGRPSPACPGRGGANFPGPQRATRTRTGFNPIAAPSKQSAKIHRRRRGRSRGSPCSSQRVGSDTGALTTAIMELLSVAAVPAATTPSATNVSWLPEGGLAEPMMLPVLPGGQIAPPVPVQVRSHSRRRRGTRRRARVFGDGAGRRWRRRWCTAARPPRRGRRPPPGPVIATETSASRSTPGLAVFELPASRWPSRRRRLRRRCRSTGAPPRKPAE